MLLLVLRNDSNDLFWRRAGRAWPTHWAYIGPGRWRAMWSQLLSAHVGRGQVLPRLGHGQLRGSWIFWGSLLDVLVIV